MNDHFNIHPQAKTYCHSGGWF